MSDEPGSVRSADKDAPGSLVPPRDACAGAAAPPDPAPSPARASSPLVRELMPPLPLALLLLAAVFGAALVFQQKRNVSFRLADDMASVTTTFRRMLALQAGVISVSLEGLLRDGETLGALAARDAGRLAELHRGFFEALSREHRITHLFFHDAGRVNLLRFHDPARRGDLIDRHTMREAERTGRVAWGVELGALGTFTLRVVAPVRAQERLLGYIEAGKEVEDLLAAFAVDPGLQLAVLVRKERLVRKDWEQGMRMLGRSADWSRLSDEVCVFSTLPGFPPADLSFPRPARGDRDAVFAGRVWHVGAVPLPDAAGDPVATLVLLRDLDDARDGMRQILRRLGLVAVPLLLFLLGFVYLRLDRADRRLKARERDLAGNEARYRALFEQAESGMAIFELLHDAEGLPRDIVALEVNPAFERHTGMPSSATVGRRMRDLYGDSPDLAILHTFAEVVRTGRPARFEWYGTKSDRHFEISAYRVGERRFACAFQNVSERKRGESEERMRAEETRRLNALMLERERRVVEIKREVNLLSAELHRPARYPSVEEERG